MQNKHHYVAIMAGGIGSRFWPMSRTSYPKQFLDILNTGRTLIQTTYDRFKKFIPEENIFIVTSEEYVEIVKEQLPELKIANIVAEPSRKNTAPCVAYISYKLRNINPKGALICAPADHLILDETAFTKVCLEALNFTSQHKALITLGIKPTHPNTGYGYIQYEQHPVSDNVYKVKTFTEKPTLDIAKTFLGSGDFLWNAGIFVWQVENIITAFEQHLPEIAEVFESASPAFNSKKEKEAIAKVYPQCTNISIDYGIMEKSSNVKVIPADIGWSDLGTWGSLFEELTKNNSSNSNAVVGSNVMLFDSSNCMIHVPKNKLVVIQGLENFIVAEKDNTLLICKMEDEQKIKNLVNEVKIEKGDEYL